MKNFGEFYDDQISHASCILLSRTQTASEEKIAADVAMLREKNPTATIVTTCLLYTSLGIADYFSCIVEAQGVLHKSRPEVFFECMHRLGGADPAACAVCELSLIHI